MEPQLIEKGGKDLKQKNIDFAAEVVAETVFYHFTDSSHKEKLKTALKMFANIIMLNREQGAQESDTTEGDSSNEVGNQNS